MAKNCMMCGKKITAIKYFLKIFWVPFFKIDSFTSKCCSSKCWYEALKQQEDKFERELMRWRR